MEIPGRAWPKLKLNILGITLARGGSKSIKNKNITLINNHPLIYYTIKEAKKSKFLSNYIVSTDSKIYSYMAKSSGSKVQIRPDLYNFNGCIFIRHNILINKTNIIITV